MATNPQEVQAAAENRQLPAWSQMDRADRASLMQQILEAIAEWRPIPKALLQPLPTKLLHDLLDVIRKLKAEGLVGPRSRPTDRVKRLKELLEARGLGRRKSLSEEDVLNQQPLQVQREQRANEALNRRMEDAVLTQGMSRALAAANRPQVGV